MKIMNCVKRPAEKVCLISLGCAKNQVDSEIISTSLLQQGFSFISDPAEADIILLNSCSFIQEAVDEAFEVLEGLKSLKKSGKCQCLVLAGCMNQRYGKTLLQKLPDVDLFLGMHVIEEAGPIIADHLAKKTDHTMFMKPLSYGQKDSGTLFQFRQALGPWAYIKITEGCSNVCSYCTLPKIRGPLRSRPLEAIITEAENLAGQGVEEINLVAQDVTAYGHDWGKNNSRFLIELLEKLNQIEAIRWIRLLYCHPSHLDDDLITVTGNFEKICPYLDLPIQHVSTSILKAMNRSYNDRDLRTLFEKIRTVRPDIALRTTVMVGFPGETEKDVEQLLHFLKDIRFHHLGVFSYSPEEGTAAYKRKETVSIKEKQNRCDMIMELQAEISTSIQNRFIGTIQDVLIDGYHDEEAKILRARTRYQAPEVDGIVLIPAENDLHQGLATARITDAHIYDLTGKICLDSTSA